MSQRRRAALITGSGRNIGRAVALRLAADGFNVAINGSRDRAACEAVAAEAEKAGAEAWVAMGDVGVADDARRLAEAAIDRFGGVDVLVNNAAIRPMSPFLDMAEDEWDRVLAVDLSAAFWLSRACLPGMVERGWGRIVNLAGMNAIQGYDGRAPVSVAKHGAWGLAKSLAKEFRAPRRHRQHRLAGADRRRAGRSGHGSPYRGHEGPCAGGPPGHPRRGGGGGCFVGLRRRRLRQRPDDPGQRRRANLSDARQAWKSREICHLSVLETTAPCQSAARWGILEPANAASRPRAPYAEDSSAMAVDDSDEHRRNPRYRTFKGGKIVYGDGGLVVNCLIRNLSHTGAKLRVDKPFDCPEQVTLKRAYPVVTHTHYI